MADMQEMLGMDNEGIETNVDIVFVIDATDSMAPVIDMVKNATLTFQDELYEVLKENKRIIKNLRVKVIWFRDFYYDGKYAYDESKFFELPEEKEDFHDFVSEISVAGGGDDPESSLEALTLAMRSDFTQEGDRKRHIIVLFTDDEAHRFEDYDKLVEEAALKGCKPEMYPKNMPKDIAEFYNAWQGNSMSQGALGSDSSGTKLDMKGRRLIIFAPDGYPWNDLEVDLENIIRCNLEKGEGGGELDMSTVYPLIGNSM